MALAKVGLSGDVAEELLHTFAGLVWIPGTLQYNSCVGFYDLFGLSPLGVPDEEKFIFRKKVLSHVEFLTNKSKSVCRIVIQGKDSDRAMSTGVFITPKRILTSAHAILEMEAQYVVGENRHFATTALCAPNHTVDQWDKVAFVAADYDLDLALFELVDKSETVPTFTLQPGEFTYEDIKTGGVVASIAYNSSFSQGDLDKTYKDMVLNMGDVVPPVKLDYETALKHLCVERKSVAPGVIIDKAHAIARTIEYIKSTYTKEKLVEAQRFVDTKFPIWHVVSCSVWEGACGGPVYFFAEGAQPVFIGFVYTGVTAENFNLVNKFTKRHHDWLSKYF